ncbi:probable aminoacyl tRNA synthase complex-interacting multifunctional protein 2 [Coccinella septempunctata]|uniref:probable aminoacyl tRNA synthase complex-interacting multifunctional protein 2 n=1 Tax=Coccinella septempunctata TaxID=41139 RepID=UPI001D0815B4|nr:probable aminoacyl tRNA synthase complex-interacting multifunctional protein 2 [Coccinella septempunctata]
MYVLRPIISLDAQIELPKCMYRMKNFHAGAENELVGKNPPHPENFGTFKQAEQFLKTVENREMAELEKRQEKLLGQLEELKKIMNSIRSSLKLPSKCTNSQNLNSNNSNSGIKKKRSYEVPDIVINANPSYPPYFLLFLQQLLKKEVFLNISCYLHSSVSKLPNVCEAFLRKLKSQENGVPSVLIRLIWKEIGPVAELNIPHYPIQGEANILRYLVRILDNELNYERSQNMIKIDELLDLSYRLSFADSKTNRTSLIQSLNKNLKSKWLTDQKEISIADVAVYDALKKFASNNEINGSLSKWFVQCEKFLEL